MKKIKLLVLLTIMLIPLNIFAYEKEEYIYTNIDTQGKEVEKVINNELKLNYIGEVKDNSYLKDILNINGNEKFTTDENTLTWESKGKSILYEGKTDKQNPIEVEIKYYLNDKEVKYNDLMNQKGNIKIVYKFINNEYNPDYKMHTPYTIALAGTIKDTDINNINITNGKIINTGNKNILAAIAAPGLYEDIELEELKSLDNITIDFETDSFKGIDVYFVATPKMLDKVDLELFNRLDSTVTSINSLQTNYNKIADGATRLNDGAKELDNGINNLYEGTTKLKAGTKTLNEGSKKLVEGTNNLVSGSYTVDENLQNIIKILDESNTSLNEKSILLKQNETQIQELINTNTNTIEKLQSVNNQITTQFSQLNLNIEDANLEQTLNNLLNAQAIDSNTYQTLITYKQTYDNNKNLITLLTANNNTINTLTTSLVTMSQEVINNLDLLKNALTKLQTEGTNNIYKGSNELLNGMTELSNGTTQLDNSTEELLNGTYQLKTGATSIKDGTNELTNGINTLNAQGINKLTNYANVANSYSNKIKQLVKMSKEYNGFTSNNSTNTTFIYKINY